MPTVTIDGIETRYAVFGSGPPLLMFSPGGFDATLDKWGSQSIYAVVKPVEHLAPHFQCIVFDRRECGSSGGRVERVTWTHYVAQGRGLLQHLGIERAHLMGGCMGCCPVIAFAVACPESVASVILWWPVGGAKYRIRAHQRFAEHLAFVQGSGLDAVVAHVTSHGKSFGADPRGGPWASIIRRDSTFADAFARLDRERYKLTVLGMQRALFDRDTVPGAEPEDLLRTDIPALIVPGRDEAHATSAARYLEECMPRAQYWDAAIAEQTEAAAAQRLTGFLTSIACAPVHWRASCP